MVCSESGHSGVGDLVRMGLGLECRLFGTLLLYKSVNIKMEVPQTVLGKLGHMSSPGLLFSQRDLLSYSRTLPLIAFTCV